MKRIFSTFITGVTGITGITGFVLLLAFAQAVPAQNRGQGQMGGMGGGQPQDMKTIHALFDGHKQIARTVKEIADGVETYTESDDPKLQALIKEHVWAMQQRLAKHQPIRQWDPLFAELFKQADKIKMEVSATAKGMKVVETSTDAYVVKLIQAHAKGVSEFVKEGMPVMHKEHPLPGTESTKTGFLGKGDGITTCPVTGEPVNKEIKWGFYGRTVYFCCENCRETVKKNPELYLKP
jgi:YHS domain-containing protein